MSQTADRYAKALFELAQEQNELEAVEVSLSETKKLISQSKDFRLFLTNPLLSYEERCKVLKALFEGKVPALALRFLLFITYKGRLNILNGIIESFDDLYLLATRQIRAYIKTADALNTEEQAFIEQRLHEKFQQKIISRWSIDPALIGGFRIFVQGKLYDYSFQDQLNVFLQKTTQLV